MSERIIVTFEYNAEPDERDSADPTGLTSEAFDALHDGLRALGATDVEVTAQ